jgi:hypothetical protein
MPAQQLLTFDGIHCELAAFHTRACPSFGAVLATAWFWMPVTVAADVVPPKSPLKGALLSSCACTSLVIFGRNPKTAGDTPSTVLFVST